MLLSIHALVKMFRKIHLLFLHFTFDLLKKQVQYHGPAVATLGWGPWGGGSAMAAVRWWLCGGGLRVAALQWRPCDALGVLRWLLSDVGVAVL